MILPVYVYGQPVLRKVAEDITPDYPNLKELIQNMFETMDHADGVGLAAPQIGLPIRVVVVDLDVLSEDYPEYKGFRKAYINAHILEVSGEEVSMEEGCLSLPGIHESVKRGNKIRVKYLDEDLVEHDEVVEGSGACDAARVRPSGRKDVHRPYLPLAQADDKGKAECHAER